MPGLQSVDLNLLLVLHTVLVEGSATKAALRLHVTQSAVSNALARLRAVFDDPLVVRSGAGLVPTPRAAELAPLLAIALEQLRTVVEAPGKFDPKSASRRFTISTTDYHEVVLIPRLVERFADTMPHSSLRVVTVEYLIARGGLSGGEIDLMVGMPPSIPPGCLAEDLFDDDSVCVLRREHPLRKHKLTPKDLASYPHVVVAVVDEPLDWVEVALRGRGLAAEVALQLPHFTLAALAVARTDYLLPFPRRLALALAPLLELRIAEMPDLDLPRATTSMLWHARTDGDPAVRFLRDLVRDAAREKKR